VALQQRVNALSEQQGITLRNMRWLVIRYAFDTVLEAVGRIEKRHHVSNPPGLLTVILRSENRKS